MIRYSEKFFLVIATLIFISALTFQSANAQTNTTGTSTVHSDIDSTPVAAVITITQDKNGNLIFNPSVTTVKQDEEVLILNNDTIAHSFTNGKNPEDPMAGKSFDTDIIKPKAFVEYIPENLKPGNYSYYSSTHPEIKGQLVVVSP